MPEEQLSDKRRPARLLQVGAAVTLMGGSSYVAMLASVARSILLMRLLGPRGRGIQRYAGILKGYLSNSSIAWRHGVSKDLPLAIGARDDRRATEVEDAGFAAVTVVTAVFALGLLLYALLWSPHDPETRIALAITAGVLLAEELVSLYWCVLRSWSNFGPLVVGELVRTASQFALMVGGAALLGVTGVMLGWLGAALVVLVYLHGVSRILIRPSLNRTHIIRLFLVGLPIAAISFSDVLLRTVDGIILVHFYGQEQLGLYSMAMQMATYLFAIPQAAGFVIWPKVLEAYGGEEVRRQRRRTVLLPTIAAAAMLPVVGGMAWLLLPAATALVVPDFLPAVPAAQVLGLGATFLALPLATNAALVARNREFVVVLAKLIGSAAIAAAVWRMVHISAPLVNIATAACAGFAISGVLSLGLQLSQFLPRRSAVVREMVLAVLPFAWSAGAIWAAQRLVVGAGLDITNFDGAVLALFTFVVLSSPCLIYGHLRTGFGAQVGSMLRGRFRQD